jgi:Uma2 family endonuclease
MSAVATPGPLPATTSHPLRLYRLSVAQYDEMARLGVLKKSDRVELIDGFMVEKKVKNERHVTTTWLLHLAFSRALAPGWFAVTESPIVLARSEPEPDVMIVRGRIQDYFRRKPAPGDVSLLVEVSDTTYLEDRARAAYYAESGITDYWIANIREQRIEVYSDPTGPAEAPEYRTRLDHGRDDTVPLIVEAQVVARLAVRDLLAPLEA